MVEDTKKKFGTTYKSIMIDQQFLASPVAPHPLIRASCSYFQFVVYFNF